MKPSKDATLRADSAGRLGDALRSPSSSEWGRPCST